MSVADQIKDHQARCLAPLTSLRMLAQGEAGVPLPRWVVVEVAQATGTVLAEAEAAALTTVGVNSDHPGDGTFLRVRLDRLAGRGHRRDRRCPRGGPRRDAPASAPVRRADLGHLDGAGRRLPVTPGQRRAVRRTLRT